MSSSSPLITVFVDQNKLFIPEIASFFNRARSSSRKCFFHLAEFTQSETTHQNPTTRDFTVTLRVHTHIGSMGRTVYLPIINEEWFIIYGINVDKTYGTMGSM